MVSAFATQQGQRDGSRGLVFERRAWRLANLTTEVTRSIDGTSGEIQSPFRVRKIPVIVGPVSTHSVPLHPVLVPPHPADQTIRRVTPPVEGVAPQAGEDEGKNIVRSRPARMTIIPAATAYMTRQPNQVPTKPATV